MLGVLVAGRSAMAGQCAGVTVPEHVTVDGIALQLNGVGLREATLLKIDVYVAALYLPHVERDAQRILALDAPRQIRLELLRAVSQADMAANIEAGFRRAAGGGFAQHATKLAQLTALIPPLAAGDTFTLTSLPARGVELRRGSQVLGAIAGAEFARCLFAIWLGEPPLSPTLKAGLLGGGCAA